MASYSAPQKRRLSDGTLTKCYFVRVYENGRRTWRSTKKRLKTEAKEVLATWRARDARGERHVIEIGFDRVAEEWLKSKALRISKSCFTVYSSYKARYVEFFGKTRMRSIEEADVEAFLRRRKRAGLSPRSLNNERKQLRSLFRFAVRRRYLLYSPADGVAVFREPKRAIRALTAEEEVRFLAACDEISEGLYCWALCLFRTGFRPVTVGRLQWQDIDFARGEWRIPAETMKSREDFHGRAIETELLANLRERARTSGAVFRRLDRKGWDAAAEAAGVAPLKPNHARKTFVTRCRRSGVPMEVAMHLSDHRDVTTVLSCYRQVDAAEAREAINLVFGKGGESSLTAEDG